MCRSISCHFINSGRAKCMPFAFRKVAVVTERFPSRFSASSQQAIQCSGLAKRRVISIGACEMSMKVARLPLSTQSA